MQVHPIQDKLQPERPSPPKTQSDTATASKTYRRQATVGVALAAIVISAWVCVHIGAIFFFPWNEAWFLAPVVIALLSWLYVGLFIIAHDCMHGSVIPFRPRANRLLGATVLFLYAGFSFDALNAKHHAHHRHAGTEHDPDFDTGHGSRFWPWYAKFFTEYLTWRQPAVIGGAITFYYFALGVPLYTLFAFWALPAILSSIQLFTFGTYLPHQPGTDAFADRHRARSNNYSWLTSLLTCFHFGYHHEHHTQPNAPWWRLPSVRATALSSRVAK